MDAFRGEEIQPGGSVESDGEMDAWIKQNCESAYHPSCTCKMGSADDPLAVLDPDCRVRGIERLRVVDASIMPIIPSANLNCPTMMIGEKAADMIAGKDPLPPENLPYFVDPNWQTDQR